MTDATSTDSRVAKTHEKHVARSSSRQSGDWPVLSAVHFGTHCTHKSTCTVAFRSLHTIQPTHYSITSMRVAHHASRSLLSATTDGDTTSLSPRTSFKPRPVRSGSGSGRRSGRRLGRRLGPRCHLERCPRGNFEQCHEDQSAVTRSEDSADGRCVAVAAVLARHKTSSVYCVAIPREPDPAPWVLVREKAGEGAVIRPNSLPSPVKFTVIWSGDIDQPTVELYCREEIISVCEKVLVCLVCINWSLR